MVTVHTVRSCRIAKTVHHPTHAVRFLAFLVLSESRSAPFQRFTRLLSSSHKFAVSFLPWHVDGECINVNCVKMLPTENICSNFKYSSHFCAHVFPLGKRRHLNRVYDNLSKKIRTRDRSRLPDSRHWPRDSRDVFFLADYFITLLQWIFANVTSAKCIFADFAID